MMSAPSALRSLPAALVVGCLFVVVPAASAEPWASVPITSSEGAVGPANVTFDRNGTGIAYWEGILQAGSPQKFTGQAVRNPATGSWARLPNIAGITWGSAQIALYSTSRTLLISRQTSSLGRFNRARFRLVYAFGHTGQSFGALRTLASDVADVVSSTNPSGDTLAAWRNVVNGRTYVAERPAGKGFGKPQALAAQPGAVAISPRGDRVIAWWARDGVYARIRRAGHGWGSAIRAAAAKQTTNAQVRLAFTPSGRIVLAWQAIDIAEGKPTVYEAGAAIRDRSGGWKSFLLEHATSTAQNGQAGTPALPVVDSTGNAYVAWTGVAQGVTAVKIVRVDSTGAHNQALLSQGVPGAALDALAAGTAGALAVTWSAPSTPAGSSVTYASLRRGSTFAPADRLTPPGVTGIGFSRVAFEPLSGHAVVTWGYLSGTHGAIRVSTSEP